MTTYGSAYSVSTSSIHCVSVVPGTVLVTPTVTVGVTVITTVVADPPAVRLNSRCTTKLFSGDCTTMAQLPSFMSA